MGWTTPTFVPKAPATSTTSVATVRGACAPTTSVGKRPSGGGGGQSVMRLQMHATDRATLEPPPGRPVSNDCIRIPATLNTFLDVHGVLDADSEAALARRESHGVLRAERQPVPWPGRYLVIVESRGGDAALLTASTAGAASGYP